MDSLQFLSSCFILELILPKRDAILYRIGIGLEIFDFDHIEKLLL